MFESPSSMAGSMAVDGALIRRESSMGRDLISASVEMLRNLDFATPELELRPLGLAQRSRHLRNSKFQNLLLACSRVL
jgi:hypothetical protein